MNKYLIFCLCLLVFCLEMLLLKNSQAADSLTTKRLSAAQVENFLKQDRPGGIQFFGSESAELFTKEVRESFKGVLEKNFKKNYNEFMPGYITASIDGRPWDDTMWSRDGGTFLRELVFWGYLDHACLLTDCLIQLVEKNDEGFYTFPEYFKKTNPGSGKELDGTAAVIIGMVHLWKRLPENNYYKNQIYQFLHQQSSPLLYIHQKLLPQPLIEGSGEFGGGCGIAGDWYNVVQNNLVRLALIAGADLEKQAGNLESCEIYMNDVKKINENMLKYLADKNSTWIWCIDPKTMLADENIINDLINKGFGGLNGVVSMLADVTGFEPLTSKWAGVKIGQNTLDKLYSFPLRKQQFDKYGIWSQFDEFREGMSSGPSYGDGYALQAMLLLDKMDMADKSVQWLAGATYSPITEYHELDRDSPYYFYERYYSPDIVGKMDLEQGCGALNLVNVTEPLKVARLIVGVDDISNNEVKIIPRVPPSWTGYNVTNWPVYTENGLVTADIRYEKKDDKIIFKFYSNGEIPQLAVRFFIQKQFKWYRWQNVSEIEFVVK